MADKPEYIYIMYPIPINEAQNLPFLHLPQPPVPSFTLPDDESFMPLWFGTARFPEDDIDD